jgi:hypothetical protein
MLQQGVLAISLSDALGSLLRLWRSLHRQLHWDAVLVPPNVISSLQDKVLCSVFAGMD